MEELQDQILRRTDELLYPINIFAIVINSLFGAVILTLFLSLFNLELTVLNVSIVSFAAIAWVTGRYFYMNNKSKKRLFNQYKYIYDKRPYADLKIPIFEKYGSKLETKNAILYFVKDTLIMEAFRKDEKGREIIGSKPIKQGKDFVIYDYQIDSRNRYVTYKASLMGANYNFSFVNSKQLIDKIETSKGAIE